MERISNISRETKETRIQAALWLSGGPVKIDTGIGFFDHMLHAWAFYAGFGLTLTAKGDLEVDGHHTVEDTGIVLGQALREALGDKVGIRRFGSAYVPMDEALAFTALDFSGRPFLVYEADMPQARMGAYDACLTEEFMRAQYGRNAHHITEALFKSLGLAMKDAVKMEGTGVTSTKGAL